LVDPARSTAPAHNSYLNALVEGGIISFILYLWLFRVGLRGLSGIEKTPRAAQHAEADGLLWLVSAVRICLLALLVFAFFADLWELVVFYFLIGTAAVLIQRYQPYVPVPARA
jgi:O-antigen ligase